MKDMKNTGETSQLYTQLDQLYNALQFQTARDLLIQQDWAKDPVLVMKKSRIDAALSDLPALKEEVSLLQGMPQNADTEQALFHAAYVLDDLSVAPGLKDYTGNDPYALYMAALWQVDHGHIKEGYKILQKAARIMEEAQKADKGLAEKERRLLVNLYMSLGDVCTFLMRHERGMFYYHKALDAASGLDNANGFRDLRTGLLYNNMADLQEQWGNTTQTLEDFEQALAYIWKAMEHDFDDKYGYYCTVINAKANFLANQMEFAAARALLEESLRLQETHMQELVNGQALYEKTRFFLALIDVYEGWQERAREQLEDILAHQKPLVQAGLEKRLEAARTAYYLAQMEEDQGAVLSACLYALPEFELQKDKDLNFYPGAIADLYNLEGIAFLEQEDYAESCRDFLKALEGNAKALQENAQEEQALHSLIVVLMNLGALAGCAPALFTPDVLHHIASVLSGLVQANLLEAGHAREGLEQILLPLAQRTIAAFKAELHGEEKDLFASDENEMENVHSLS